MRAGPRIDRQHRQRRRREGLFAEMYPSLRRFAASFGPPWVEPDDLVQEALTRTLRRHRLDDLDDARVYLMKVIANLARNERRDEAVRQRHVREGGAGQVAECEDYPSDIDFLYTLAAPVRTALVLVELEGYRVAEAAEVVGISAVALRARLSRARRAMRQQLAKEERSERAGTFGAYPAR